MSTSAQRDEACNAATIRIEVLPVPDMLRVRICDDGCGGATFAQLQHRPLTGISHERPPPCKGPPTW
jgi:hypothetical protein